MTILCIRVKEREKMVLCSSCNITRGGNKGEEEKENNKQKVKPKTKQFSKTQR